MQASMQLLPEARASEIQLKSISHFNKIHFSRVM